MKGSKKNYFDDIPDIVEITICGVKVAVLADKDNHQKLKFEVIQIRYQNPLS